jgi:SAM-dependent methyltransferase
VGVGSTRNPKGDAVTTFDARAYWETRYGAGGHSGDGSRGEMARLKAGFLNRLVATEEIDSLVELGCGDGRQLALADYPSYLGLDVSPTAVELCRARFATDATKRFALYDAPTFTVTPDLVADATLSLDVVYHLVADEDFDAYMSHLFECARRFVVVYSTNVADSLPDQSPHVRHRRFTDWIERRRPEWMLCRRTPIRPGRTRHDCDFFVFTRR